MRPGAWKAWVAAAALLLVGMGVGSLITIGVGRRIVQRIVTSGDESPLIVNRLATRFEREVSGELKLTPAQSLRTHRELRAAIDEFRQLRKSSSQQFQQIIARAVARASEGLDPAQKIALEKMINQRMQRVGLEYRSMVEP